MQQIINEARSFFLTKINKIDALLVRLTKRERRPKVRESEMKRKPKKFRMKENIFKTYAPIKLEYMKEMNGFLPSKLRRNEQLKQIHYK